MKQADPPTPQDLVVDDLLEEALKDYVDLVPDEVLAEIRSSLGDLLYAHPDGQRILRQLEVDPMLSGSGDVTRPDDEANKDDDGKLKVLRPKKAQS